MKKVTLVVAVAVSAILIGCQDNSNVNPVGSEFATAPSKVVIYATNQDGTIELQGQLSLGQREGVDNTFDLYGQITYALVQADDQNFALSLVADASLVSLQDKGPSGRVYGESIEEIAISPKAPSVFQKRFSITGFDKEVDLRVQFSVSPESVVVESMWLEESALLGSPKAAK